MTTKITQIIELTERICNIVYSTFKNFFENFSIYVVPSYRGFNIITRYHPNIKYNVVQPINEKVILKPRNYTLKLYFFIIFFMVCVLVYKNYKKNE